MGKMSTRNKFLTEYWQPLIRFNLNLPGNLFNFNLLIMHIIWVAATLFWRTLYND